MKALVFGLVITVVLATLFLTLGIQFGDVLFWVFLILSGIAGFYAAYLDRRGK